MLGHMFETTRSASGELAPVPEALPGPEALSGPEAMPDAGVPGGECVLGDDELLGLTDAAWVRIGRAHRELLDLLREVDRREAWRDQGAEDL
ncbi:MAG TPA: hypothetical protein VLA87_01120, partial [Gaiellaceae bacterium]|nr:hypothetical protein [Gaiellaceae bacterium]